MQRRYVIYTCIVGDYDKLQQPLSIDADFDYICFSNDIEKENVGVWEIRKIPYNCNDKARFSRYVKIMPHTVLQDYDYSLWLDANIQIIGSDFYKLLKNKISEGGLIYQVNHCLPPCDCIYDEMKFAFRSRKCGFFKTLLQYRRLKKSGFPSHWGLFENNIILRKHCDEVVKKISQEWWMEYLKYTKRDQFSLMYIYWLNNIYPFLLLEENECTRNVPYLRWSYHKKEAKVLEKSNNYPIWRRYSDIVRYKLTFLFDFFCMH